LGFPGAVAVFAAFLAAAVASGAAPAAADSLYAPGPFTLPEAIIAAPGGGYLISDADNEAVYEIPSTGGGPTATDPVNFRAFGEVALTSYYGDLSGQYLEVGTDSTSSYGVAALLGASGVGSPTTVLDAPNAWFGGAVVAPAAFGAISQGQVVIANELGGKTVEALDASGDSLTTFASLSAFPNAAPFGLGFAPASFGADAGDLFVTDVYSGNLYVLNAEGQASLFATLPLPSGYSQPGLRQIAWAPAGFGAYGGDLFVSVAAQNGGGGATGEIDVLNASGKTIAIYNQGSAASNPLDPRGLYFVNDTTLLVANADPEIDLVAPSDFIPAPAVPEPAAWTLMLVGVAGLGAALRRKVRTATLAI
jgi:hypothetical protein